MSKEREVEVTADCEDVAAKPPCRSCGYFEGTHSTDCPVRLITDAIRAHRPALKSSVYVYNGTVIRMDT